MNRRGFLSLITVGIAGSLICNKSEASEKKKLEEAFKKIEEYDIQPQVIFYKDKVYRYNTPLGDEGKPATDEEIRAFQELLANTYTDPNTVIVWDCVINYKDLY